jgi:hypothetical protein
VGRVSVMIRIRDVCEASCEASYEAQSEAKGEAICRSAFVCVYIRRLALSLFGSKYKQCFHHYMTDTWVLRATGYEPGTAS